MPAESRYPRFDRKFFDSTENFTVIGSGELGGKAQGLAFLEQLLAARFDARLFPGFTVTVPRLTVVTTQVFDAFIEENGLRGIASSDDPDRIIAHAFQKASLPAQFVGDLRALVESVRRPLAVRSSSLLEDALFEPFAGVYETKMTPNNEPDADARFRKLSEAVKLVYASTFFKGAKAYAASVGRDIAEEKMSVIVQEVVGDRLGDRFYPTVSGVARSFNFYPAGLARPEEGVIALALGLGKTIVDGGACWSYCPAYPKSGPPFGSNGDLLDNTQLDFWAVNMGRPPAYDPIAETEYLVRAGLTEAEADGSLRFIASSYDPDSDRMTPGIGGSGPRALTFAPLLGSERIPLNDVVRALLDLSRDAIGADVELEFAVRLDRESGVPARFGFLQVRPLVVSRERVTISGEELRSSDVLVSSRTVLGNGIVEGVRDVVYLKPDRFDSASTRRIASELESFDRGLARERRPYVLIGFGRWGTSDPWLGVPVTWSQIAGARVIVEASLAGFNADPSQGSHFFHNITSRQVPYFTVKQGSDDVLRWDALERRAASEETEFVRRVRFEEPLCVRVDGRSGCGVIRTGKTNEAA